MRTTRLIDAGFAVLGIACLLASAAFVRHRLQYSTSSTDPFAPRVLPGVHRLAAQGDVLGRPDAPIRLVEFSDFQCPFCRRLHRTLETLRTRHPEIAIVYRHFPLAIHDQALPSAIAAECAADQGKFEPYARLLFEEQDSLRDGIFEPLAADAGIADPVRFAACRANRTPMQRVSRDIEAGEQLEIVGTPVLIIGDTVLVGAMPDSLLEARLAPAIEAARATRRIPATP